MVSSSGCERRCFRGRWQPPAACTKHAASSDHAGRMSGLLRSKRKLSPWLGLGLGSVVRIRVRGRGRAKVRVVHEDRGPTKRPEEARPVVQSNLVTQKGCSQSVSQSLPHS